MKLKLELLSRVHPLPDVVVLAALLLLGSGGMTRAQVSQGYWECREPSSSTEAGWCPTSATNPLPVTGGGGGAGGSSAITINPSLPTIATATAVPVGSKAGAGYSQPVFDSALGGGQQVGVATGLPVQGAGAAAYPVAVKATSLPVVGILGGQPVAVTATALPIAGTNGTSVASQTNPIPIQGLPLGNPVPVTATHLAVDIEQVYGASFATGIPIYATTLAVTSGYSQASTTSGQTLSPIGCRTLTSAPTDTTAQSNIPWCLTNGSLAVDNVPFSAGGLSLNSQFVPANNTAVAIDASPGQIYKIEAYNNNATILYLNYFNAASASTDCKSTGTAILHEMVPANSTSGAGMISVDVFGLPFSTAITQCAGTVFGGTGLPTADEYIVNVFYK